MARVTITCEDRGDGHVQVKADPNFQQLATLAAGQPDSITPAHVYGMRALRAITELSKETRERDGALNIVIPKQRLVM